MHVERDDLGWDDLEFQKHNFVQMFVNLRILLLLFLIQLLQYVCACVCVCTRARACVHAYARDFSVST